MILRKGICKTCGLEVEGSEKKLLNHLIAYHSVAYNAGLESHRAMSRLIEDNYNEGDDGSAGVREPLRPKPDLPAVSATADEPVTIR